MNKTFSGAIIVIVHIYKMRLITALFKNSLLAAAGAAALQITFAAPVFAGSIAGEIAANSEYRKDPVTNDIEVIAPEIDARFESGHMRGRALLRSAGLFTDDRGIVHRGGAYLDLSLYYETGSDSAYGARIYDHVDWPGEREAMLADFHERILECGEQIRAISYFPAFYRYGFAHAHHRRHHRYRRWPGSTLDRDRRRRRPHPGTRRPRPDDDGPLDRPRRPRDPDTRRPRRPRPDSGTGSGNPDPVTRPRRPREPDTRRPRPPAVTGKPIVSRPRPDMEKSAPRSKPPERTRPKPQSRTRPKARTQSRRPARTERPNRQRSGPRTHNNFFPDFGRAHPDGHTQYVTSYHCLREESLRIFIPRERLKHLRDFGITLYLRPEIGATEVVHIGAEYVDGFAIAKQSPPGPALRLPPPAPYGKESAADPTGLAGGPKQ